MVFKEDQKPAPPPETFAQKLARWFPQLSASAIENLSKYHDELLRFNKTVNLISPSTVNHVAIVHFADCILASQLVAQHLLPDAPLYDFGSGNGFPGLVFGILYPGTPVVLVEKDSRKAEFLKHVRSLLNLDAVEVRVGDVEKLPENSIVNAIARDFAPLHKVMLTARHQIKAGGKFFHLKTDSWPQELAGIPSQLFTVWTPSLLGHYSLPETGVGMAVVITEKLGK